MKISKFSSLRPECVALILVTCIYSARTEAQLTPGWKKVFQDRPTLVHTESVALTKNVRGEKVLNVWTAEIYSPPLVLDGQSIASTRTGWSVLCDGRTASQEIQLYDAPDLRQPNLKIRQPLYEFDKSIEPDSLPMALQKKYCNPWAFWR